MYTLLISGLVIFTSAHVASVALTNYIVNSKPAITVFKIDVPVVVKATITKSALPVSARDYLAQHHAGEKIKEAAEIVDAIGKKTYEAEVGGKDLIFDEKGQLIK